MNTAIKILVVADYESIQSMLRESLTQRNVHFTTSREVKKEIDRIAPDVVLLVQPEDGTGVELVQYIQGELPEGIIIFFNGKARLCPGARCCARGCDRIHSDARRAVAVNGSAGQNRGAGAAPTAQEGSSCDRRGIRQGKGKSIFLLQRQGWQRSNTAGDRLCAGTQAGVDRPCPAD